MLRAGDKTSPSICYCDSYTHISQVDIKRIRFSISSESSELHAAISAYGSVTPQKISSYYSDRRRPTCHPPLIFLHISLLHQVCEKYVCTCTVSTPGRTYYKFLCNWDINIITTFNVELSTSIRHYR